MAHQLTRVEKAAPIFQRITGLIRAGQMKWEERPLWYDVYVLCPPVNKPVWNIDMAKKDEPVRKLFYGEDLIRAKFFNTYGNPGVYNLFASAKYVPISELFVKTYNKVQKESPSLSPDDIFEETSKILIEDGVKLRKRREK